MHWDEKYATIYLSHSCDIIYRYAYCYIGTRWLPVFYSVRSPSSINNWIKHFFLYPKIKQWLLNVVLLTFTARKNHNFGKPYLIIIEKRPTFKKNPSFFWSLEGNQKSQSKHYNVKKRSYFFKCLYFWFHKFKFCTSSVSNFLTSVKSCLSILHVQAIKKIWHVVSYIL